MPVIEFSVIQIQYVCRIEKKYFSINTKVENRFSKIYSSFDDIMKRVSNFVLIQIWIYRDCLSGNIQAKLKD